MSYTFREEWRRARAEAQKWRSGAYLVSGSGQYVNDDGVPNSWSLRFIDKADADAVLLVDIDPWGKVTQTRQVTGAEWFHSSASTRSECHTTSSTAIRRSSLAKRHWRPSTTSPRRRNRASASTSASSTGSGPYWTYTLFYESTAEYVSVHVHAITSAVTPVS